MEQQNYKKLYPTAFILYLSFFVHGFGAAILSQNTNSLQSLWNTDAAGVLYVISALGIGRLITYPFSGAISDKFGRRLTVIIGCLVYICFFGGILIAPNVQVALALTKLPFADQQQPKKEEVKDDVPQVKANFWIEGIALIIMGYSATATFQVFLNINKDYGMTFLQMSEIMKNSS